MPPPASFQQGEQPQGGNGACGGGAAATRGRRWAAGPLGLDTATPPRHHRHMTTPLSATPLQPGDRAPDLTVPAVTREGQIALADYQGRSPILLALLRGLY